MDDLMLRRRMMAPANDWDYKWTYTDGLLENNGWTKTINGTADSVMAEAGQQLTAMGSSYVALENPNFSIITSGCIEVVAACTYLSGSDDNHGNAAQNLRVSVSNGTNGIQTCINGSTQPSTTGQGLKLFNATQPKSGTLIAPWASGSEHTLRLELRDNLGYVYLDGVEVAAGVDPSTIFYCTTTRIMFQNGLAGASAVLKSVKIKRY